MENEYRTQSISLAAFLSLMGYPLIDVVNTGMGTKSMFVFEDSEELQNMIKAFWNETELVSPQRYFSELRSVKARLYS